MKKILALVMVLVMACSVMAISASAAESPTAAVYYDLTFTDYAQSTGLCTVDPARVAGGETSTISVANAEENGFTGWTLTGDYTIVSGDLNSEVLVIEVYSDILIDASFTNAPTNVPTDAPTAAPNTSPTSPQTGPLGSNQLAVYVVLLAGVAILFGVLYKVKKRA